MPLEIDFGVTGTRKGATSEQKGSFRRLARLFYGQFHEGDCEGVDVEAAAIIDDIGGYFIHVHPPASDLYRAFYTPKSPHRVWEVKPYADRDLDIVTESDAMCALPSGYKEMKRGSGTWLTVRMARAELKPLAIIWPNGMITYERWSSMLPHIEKLDLARVR